MRNFNHSSIISSIDDGKTFFIFWSWINRKWKKSIRKSPTIFSHDRFICFFIIPLWQEENLMKARKQTGKFSLMSLNFQLIFCWISSDHANMYELRVGVFNENSISYNFLVSVCPYLPFLSDIKASPDMMEVWETNFLLSLEKLKCSNLISFYFSTLFRCCVLPFSIAFCFLSGLIWRRW